MKTKTTHTIHSSAAALLGFLILNASMATTVAEGTALSQREHLIAELRQLVALLRPTKPANANQPRVSASPPASQPAVQHPSPPSAADEQVLVNANNAFAFDLMSELALTQPGQNVFISPYSVSSALQMVGVGAAGQTKTEMQQVLGTTGLSTNALYSSIWDLDQQLASRTNVTLNLANAIWCQQGFPLKPAFTNINAQVFQAQLGAVDFNQRNAADTINHWADLQTHGKIPQVVQFPFLSGTRLLLADAIYFKGNWLRPFDAGSTQPLDFDRANGQSEQVPMMTQEGSFAYQENPQFQAVKLEYAGGLEMEVFLPGANSSPEVLLATIAAAGGGLWNTIQANFAPSQGVVLLPKFTLNYDVTLNDSLVDLGMPDAFDARANFSGISGAASLCISQVKHKSFIEVDEEGTEAAAATTVTVGVSVTAFPVPPLDEFTMILDRPFLFVISDVNTGSILFMGVVNDPAN